MENKETIIDGVDVSGCCQYMPRYMEDYDIDTLDYCRHYFKPCKDVDVKYCYYKQLKRKEQECEELKKERDTLSVTRDKLLDDLWVVEENLKDYTEHFNKASDELDQLKQTLTEIKEIAKNMNNECFYDDFDCEDCDMKNGCTYFNKKQILQKISECEVEND